MERWRRFRYLPVDPLGEDGRRVTGSKEHIQLSCMAAGEGMVLLKNENSVLPLSSGHTVALFGKASVDYVKGGGGSGDTTVAYVRDFCETMQQKAQEGRVKIFEPLCDFYYKNVAEQRLHNQEALLEGGTQVSKEMKAGMTVEPRLPLELLDAAAETCDMAIVTLSRYSKEAYDRTGEKQDGDFYLSPDEELLVGQVLERFEQTIVILNIGGMIDTTWFCEEKRIPAVLLAWQGGMEGASAQADILFGDVNPSGRLTDTFAKSFDDYPSSYNFHESEDYVCYTDDVFVGYRYFETIPGAADRVNYPFGYGLSYTEFQMECRKACESDGTVRLEVAVTNIGKVAGKEVVQIYSGAPKCRLEIPRLQLRAFAKTRLLEPGETEECVLEFRMDELAAYEEEKAAYILFEGTYPIYMGNNIRSIKEVYTVEVPTEFLVRQLVNRCVPRKLPCRMKADGSMETLTVSEYEKPAGDEPWREEVVWKKAEHILVNQYGMPIPKERKTLSEVADGSISLEEFMETMTDDELITLVGGTPNRSIADTRGIGGLDHLGIPAVMTADGPAGLRVLPSRGVHTTAWPVATLLACTWDVDLMYQIGVAGAREVKENNLGIWLTPAINIHRSPLCGRNFEYFSEDPLLSGKLASAKIRGIQSEHISACVKHFCANNKETNRRGSDSRVSERALREIYLKAFEIVVQESDVWAVMTSYNLLNGVNASENQELLEGILREEWGFDGLVMSDWSPWDLHDRELLAGNNLRMPDGKLRHLQRALREGVITREILVKNARYILEWILRLD